jgi:hypothetical protein
MYRLFRTQRTPMQKKTELETYFTQQIFFSGLTSSIDHGYNSADFSVKQKLC